jgi:hypothetical protein
MLEGKTAGNLDKLLTELISFGLIFSYQRQLINLPSLLIFQLPPDADYGPQPDDHARLKPQAAAPAPHEFVSLVTRLALVLKANPDRFTARQWPVPQPIELQVVGLSGWPHYPAELEALKYDKQAINRVYTRSFGVPPPSPVIDEACWVARAVSAICGRSVGLRPAAVDHLGTSRPAPAAAGAMSTPSTIAGAAAAGSRVDLFTASANLTRG